MKCMAGFSKPIRIVAVLLAVLLVLAVGYGIVQLLIPKGEPYRIRVATYNVGSFTGKEFDAGSEEGNAAYRELIAEVDADLWAFQEDVQCVDENAKVKPNEAIYTAFPYYDRRGTGKFNYKSFASHLELKDTDYFYYESLHTLGHKMFMRTTVDLGNKELCLINVHLDWQDPNTRFDQINQLIAYAEKFEYVIIMGDFNAGSMSGDMAAFTKAGFVPANSGEFGVVSTYVHHGGSAIDNILVSKNIRIEAVGNAKADWLNDHIPFWADIVIE